ncbi:hypothetical protein VTK73DRAFT_7401 [Phialemonium thermophilum]|uniref:RFX-type winged-helix domain-containing protein n=1 Tax=Phialemonium thermophilum TaxID=223376 RepID=A0ABR3XTN2_9PEZI
MRILEGHRHPLGTVRSPRFGPMDSPDSHAMVGTRSRKRPRSRGSTASIHSATTQQNVNPTFGDSSDMYSAHWLPNDQNQRQLAPNPASLGGPSAPHDISAESLILQAASHLHAAGARDYPLDASGDVSMHGGSFHHHPNLGRNSMSAESFGGNASFAEDSQMLDRDGNDDNESYAGMQGGLKPGSRTSANNELEMRQLFLANKHRSLQEVAQELHGNERGPNSERTRQVFAMLWINQVCSRGEGSVPRGRVYANYASRCATERITVLNPASFGKLVRVLFPGLKTRRLGVRGESKYHYVDFTLAEEQPDVRETSAHPQMPLTENLSFNQSFHSLPSQPVPSRLDRALFPTPDNLGHPLEEPVVHHRSHEFRHSLYNQPMVSSFEQLQSTMAKTPQKLCFAPDTGGFQQSEPLVLPRIEPFLPEGTDPDTAKSLAALYRSHCTSLVECIRYCKEKTFFHLFTSFQGTLTMPVQKLFGNPALAPWIEECDFVLYQRMMRIVSGLALQVVPKPVLDTLRNISERLVPHIQESFQGQPAHVIRAKEAPATIFAALLDRALRVNLTAHAAANMLSNPGNRDLMYMEWITMVYVRKVAECVPSRAMDDVVNLLLTEIRGLLDPVSVPWDVEALTLHGDVALKTGRQPAAESTGETTASNVLDRWVSFLRSLPSRFPYASHTDIVWCVQRIGTAVMRDLTIAQGKSFGSWWVTKCWIDEMIQFLAEQGGFMSQKSSHTSAALPKGQTTSLDMGRQSSRQSSGSDDFRMSHVPQTQPDQSRFSSAPMSNSHDVLGAGQTSHDDSGIGIRTPDEDLPMKKLPFGPSVDQDPFSGTELQQHAPNI